MRENSEWHAFLGRARLQSCRKYRKIIAALAAGGARNRRIDLRGGVLRLIADSRKRLTFAEVTGKVGETPF